MSKPVSPKMIGAFVATGLALLIIAVMVLGGGRFFRDRAKVVMYFEGSVAGLAVGAPVTFRGVRVGTVTKVFIRYNVASRDIVIPVFAELFPENILVTSGETTQDGVDRDRSIDDLTKDGLRAQLTVQSLLTGQLAITLDYTPGATGFAPPNAYRHRIEIPTTPSPLQEVQATVQELVTKVRALPLEALVQNADELLRGANRLINDPRVMSTIDNANQALIDVQRVAGTLERQIPAVVETVNTTATAASSTMRSLRERADQGKDSIEEINRSLAEAQRTMQQLQAFLANANGLIAPDSTVTFELTSTLREVATTARALRSFTSLLERSPNAVIFGRQPSGR